MTPATSHAEASANAAGHNGPISLDRANCRVHIDGEGIAVGRRAFEIMELLVAAEGAIVTKDEIAGRIWPGASVCENNIQVHVAALRKALGPHRALIGTVSGMGYRIAVDRLAAAPSLPAERAPARGNIPAKTSDLVGRADLTTLLSREISSRRIVTLTGVGGIGKTRLALDVARLAQSEFPDGAWLIDLARLATGDSLPGAIAASLGLGLAGGADNAEQVVRALHGRSLLILLDNCEHLVEAAAQFAELLLRSVPTAKVLSTSREPLRIDGEAVFNIPALELPPAWIEDLETVAGFSAIQLFIERVRGRDRHFQATDSNISALATLCRQLEGIPLAIELAAARAASLDIVAFTLKNGEALDQLGPGLRTSTPRHQTMRAALDWSYDLLDDIERNTLNYLSIFSGTFTLAAAQALLAEDGVVALGSVASLVDKSLLVRDGSKPVVLYRLLETTRAYGLERLRKAGRLECVRRRHASYMLGLLVKARSEHGQQPAPQWLRRHSWMVDDVRAAVDWARQAGETSLYVQLASAASHLMLELSLTAECARDCRHALAEARKAGTVPPGLEMRLESAIGIASAFVRGGTRESEAAWLRVLDLARKSGDPKFEAQALWGLYSGRIYGGSPQAAFDFATRFMAHARQSKDDADIRMAHRMMGVSLHYVGDQDSAKAHLEYVLSRYDPQRHGIEKAGYHVDPMVVTEATLARIDWLQGRSKDALARTTDAVGAAQSLGHPMSLCYALLAAAVPLRYWMGDPTGSSDALQLLADTCACHGIRVGEIWARSFRAVLAIHGGDERTGVFELQASLEVLKQSGFTAHYLPLAAELAQGLAALGRISCAYAVIDEALEISGRGGEGWILPELLRIQGEIHMLDTDRSARAKAERCIEDAITQARSAGAMAWEERCRGSLTRLGRATQIDGPGVLPEA